MVLYKRKPIVPPAPPREFPPEQEVWVMQHTGEVFGTYDEYCSRYDYYSRKKFTCEVTGHRNLTFFDALMSETEGAAAVESKFPELLREPVLRRAQFSTISRIDELVKHLHEEFKEDFYPGERVYGVRADTGTRVSGIIRDKIVFSEARSADGTVLNKQNVRYFISVDDQPDFMGVMDSDHIFRMRRNFSKQMLRSFLRNSVWRERWDGAPWLVKEELAHKYHIDTEIPSNLTFEHRLMERKAHAALKRGKLDDESLEFFVDQGQLQDVLPTLKNQKTKVGRRLVPKLQPHLQSLSIADNLQEYPALKAVLKTKKVDQAPIIQKYPIEDLDLPIKRDGVSRPPLNYISNRNNSAISNGASEGVHGIDDASVGPLLEIWDALNVHADFFVIDSFTFDDFVEALNLPPESMECELISEIHCAMLKHLVTVQGEVEVDLPNTPVTSAETSNITTPDPEQEPQPEPEPETTTRSRRGRAAASEPSRKVNGEQVGDVALHRADEMQGEYDWTQRVQNRDFAIGGWQVALVGLLYQLSSIPARTEVCQRILAHLAPLDQYPNPETARRQYADLDINLRIAALEIVLRLCVTTKGLKNYMLECEEVMTQERKARAEATREKKTVMEELSQLENQRKILMPDAPVEDVKQTSNGDAEDAEVDADGDVTMNGVESQNSDEEPHKGRGKGRSDRAKKNLKRKREDQEKAAKDAAAAKQSAEFRKVLKEIEQKKDEIRDIEDRIAMHEAALRENYRHRTKSLGRDRYWNRYFWFERNSMPVAGNENSSTSDYGYANARIWVQGPDDAERTGFIDLDEREADKYKTKFGRTPRERQAADEGSTRLETSLQWGFYDDKASLDALIAYLDDRGEREKDLRKELQGWRDSIAEQMDRMSEHLAAVEAKKAASEEPVVGIATRKKTNVDLSMTKYPCLAWKNSAARASLGRLHSDAPPARKPGRGATKGKDRAPVIFEKRETRRGTRY